MNPKRKEPGRIYAYQLKRLSQCLLQKMDEIEAGRSYDASFCILRQKLMDLSVNLNPVGEDILKSLAHHLTVAHDKGNETLTFMRDLVRELIQLYDLNNVSFLVTSEKCMELARPDYISRRMSGADFAVDLGGSTKKHPERSPWHEIR